MKLQIQPADARKRNAIVMAWVMAVAIPGIIWSSTDSFESSPRWQQGTFILSYWGFVFAVAYLVRKRLIRNAREASDQSRSSSPRGRSGGIGPGNTMIFWLCLVGVIALVTGIIFNILQTR